MTVVIQKWIHTLFEFVNNWDTEDEDYGSVFYDFYNFDIGKPFLYQSKF